MGWGDARGGEGMKGGSGERRESASTRVWRERSRVKRRDKGKGARMGMALMWGLNGLSHLPRWGGEGRGESQLAKRERLNREKGELTLKT